MVASAAKCEARSSGSLRLEGGLTSRAASESFPRVLREGWKLPVWQAERVHAQVKVDPTRLVAESTPAGVNDPQPGRSSNRSAKHGISTEQMCPQCRRTRPSVLALQGRTCLLRLRSLWQAGLL